MRYRCLLVLTLACLAGCGNQRVPVLGALPNANDLPFLYKIDVQQGNVIDQDMVGRLRAGMDKKKVQFIMGTPIIQDTFNDERWDYVYTFHHGGGHTERRRITLIFEDDVLARVEGDVKPAETPLIVDVHQDLTVAVPRLKKKSLMTKIKETMPFTEAEEEKAVVLDERGNPVDADAVDEEEDDLSAELAAVNSQALGNEVSPYANIQAAPGEGIIVPPDAPTNRKEKGFFGRLIDGIGLGADEAELDAEDEDEYDPGEPGYRDITDQNEV